VLGIGVLLGDWTEPPAWGPRLRENGDRARLAWRRERVENPPPRGIVPRPERSGERCHGGDAGPGAGYLESASQRAGG